MTDHIMVDYAAFPPEEHSYARQIVDNLHTLEIGARDFRYTVEFYMHVRELYRAPNSDVVRKAAWTKMAGRHGAIVAASIIEVTKDISGTRSKAPEVWRRADLELKKAADKLLAKHFANVHGVRTISAHPGELHATAKERAKHALKSPTVLNGTLSIGASVFGEGSFLADSMTALDEGLIFSGSFRRQMTSYTLSEETANILAEVVALYHATFYDLESAECFSRRQQEFFRRQHGF